MKLKELEKLINESRIIDEDKIKCIADVRNYLEAGYHICDELIRCGIDESEARKLLPGVEIESI